MSDRIYSWRKHLNGDAQAVGEWVESLSEKSADVIVREAKKKRSPAHGIFEWSDTEAAHQFRLVQARVMLSSLRVEVVNSKQEPIEVNAFISSSVKGEYVGTLDATDDELTAAEQKFLDLIYRLEERYDSLRLAQPVIRAIRQVRQSTARKKRKAA